MKWRATVSVYTLQEAVRKDIELGKQETYSIDTGTVHAIGTPLQVEDEFIRLLLGIRAFQEIRAERWNVVARFLERNYY